ncbi:hypothetical protein ACW7C8_17995 [Klebsiella pneumoniae]|uniref:hypothetical protein n=1 Tax=Klebsiella pneumoniae TaxID=573 RepID=UPI000A21BF24|nr:hypothetical protein [Klebsiella pneumoniae]MDA5470445.1 hypothetical protein [Klebsiella pneumoniae]MDE8836395.1 hypothetical protein [Klebsiella pneumoniae]MDE8841263.1 hypothetical protein [Klebsiella pneumoniae]MDE8931766.1 hypothetical protein [Klebsiella pneumoniae]MDE9045839.1 hypothetical protein [Klebsiella pneumoniae]
MTDIARLINSIKRRTSSARELGYDVLFVALDDLDVLADSLETALHANAGQATYIEQLQDIKHQLELKLAKQVVPVVPDFKKLARELVDNLVDCGGLDEGVKEKYLEWAEKTCRTAMLAAAPQEVDRG